MPLVQTMTDPATFLLVIHACAVYIPKPVPSIYCLSYHFIHVYLLSQIKKMFLLYVLIFLNKIYQNIYKLHTLV